MQQLGTGCTLENSPVYFQDYLKLTMESQKCFNLINEYIFCNCENVNEMQK